ncbi:hypothetical protein BCR42DRAFT_58116 [Absidia repens]|uniref:Uncharacterized protein n=1 Tax=Absidia repens TaxID=90262 RepID=A0A1X2IFJ1_9FUNG|nr:hypothetical protein BCR42DRAFT_58116 [Absidia repens]
MKTQCTTGAWKVIFVWNLGRPLFTTVDIVVGRKRQAVICYDLDMEGFLLNILKEQYRYKVQRQTHFSSPAVATTTTDHPIKQGQILSKNPEAAVNPLVAGNLKKLSHVALQTLQSELKLFQVVGMMHSSQRPIVIGDDDNDDDNDSFYSAEDETLFNQYIAARIQSIVDSHLFSRWNLTKNACMTLLENLTST